MNIEERKDLLVALGNYLRTGNAEWESVKQRANVENPWFTPEFIDLAVKNITDNFLQPDQLQLLIDKYNLAEEHRDPKKVGIVMAGNIPLVGFHDLLCVFITGHICVIKPSSKDKHLVEHVVKKMIELDQKAQEFLFIREMLKNCDAYIATGSNNSARYFEYYFRNVPHIIRRNRTSVAVLTGSETSAELESLADDVHLYFGLGCRNVTKIFVPEHYDFVPLLNAFKKYNYFTNHNKYKNNYDYNLAVHILNKKYYMTNDSILLIEDESPFSPISQLHYQYYKNMNEVNESLANDERIQCVVSQKHYRFGEAQSPEICTYSDDVDTIQFLLQL